VNRFAALGLLYEASKGKRILVISHDQRQARKDMNIFEPLLDHEDKLIRAHGNEQIQRSNGGRIWFRSVNARIQGMSADIAFIEDREELTEDIIIAVNGGEIVRA